MNAREFCDEFDVTFTADPALSSALPVTKTPDSKGRIEFTIPKSTTSGWAAGTYTITATQTGEGCDDAITDTFTVKVDKPKK